MIHAVRLSVLIVLLVLPGCRGPAPHEPGPAPASGPASRPTTDAERAGGAEALRQRAERLWAARAKDDYATVFEFQDPRQVGTAKVEEFVEWSKANEPFKYEAYKLGRVETQSRIGWVEVDQKMRVRKYADAPPNEMTRWETWHVMDGRWVLVPLPEIKALPQSPALRDAAQEQRLRARAEEASRARIARDFETLYQYMHPREREELSYQRFASTEAKLEFAELEMEWVEAVGRQGRVSFIETFRFVDPSATKMGYQKSRNRENWLLYENEWYFSLKES